MAMDIPSKHKMKNAPFAMDDEEAEEKFLSKRVSNKIAITKESSRDEQRTALLWALLASYLPEDVRSMEKFFVHHVEYSLARGRGNINNFGAYQALALSVRDRLIERWKDTQLYFKEKQCKRVAYMSLEFLLGRTLQNAIVNLGLEDNYHMAMKNLGYHLENLYDEESDAGLGNGGLGRLAACFLDSLATMDYPAWGYGLRYKYGMFYQKIQNGQQVEFPDYWLMHGNPWEVERSDVSYPVQFYGKIRDVETEDGSKKVIWDPAETVMAVAYDTPIPGYETYNVLNIRLWSAQPSKEFDLHHFNKGDFFKSIEEKQNSEQITSVLYPNDNTPAGKELRLKQQYLLVSATLQDLMRRFKETKRPISEFHTQVAIQLNDTHPALGIVELVRILLDNERVPFAEAWEITTKTFAYTNHTVLPEALERWPVTLMERLLPRLMRIIYDINYHFLKVIEKKWPGDVEKLRRLSVIEEGDTRMVRMANLAIIGSHAVNGVAQIHSDLLRSDVFPDFFNLWPKKFLNMTNGVTPRRWLHQANPDLSMILTSYLRTPNWIFNLDLLTGLRHFADNPTLQKQWILMKQTTKERLAKMILKKTGIEVSTEALFDTQVKRIHEYKRQLLNILYIIHRYTVIKAMSPAQRKSAQVVPRVVIFGGKAAPGYFMAKLVIQLINSVGKIINNDEDIGDLLKVVFIPNYCVSLAEIIVPGSDLSQHISTAGMEASGTSNMKFAMNGCLIIGTLDGANVEIEQEIGSDNIFFWREGARGRALTQTVSRGQDRCGPSLGFRALPD
jgi:starch phosphorylase